MRIPAKARKQLLAVLHKFSICVVKDSLSSIVIPSSLKEQLNKVTVHPPKYVSRDNYSKKSSNRRRCFVQVSPALHFSCEFCEKFNSIYFVEPSGDCFCKVLIKRFNLRKNMELQTQNKWRFSLHLFGYLQTETFSSFVQLPHLSVPLPQPDKSTTFFSWATLVFIFSLCRFL